MEQFVVIPGPRGDNFVELSHSAQGRVFRKQILKFGDLFYPGIKGGKVKVDDAFADTVVANFARGLAIVQVPKVDGDNKHTQDPDRNLGEVINVLKTAKGIYADIDVRTADADKIGKTLLGISAMLDLDFVDTDTGEGVGPTLVHTAVTNNPYVSNLEGFQELLAASRPGVDIHGQVQVLELSTADDKETELMTREEMIAALLAEHSIDVADLQAKAAQVDASVALSKTIQETLVGTGLLTLSNTTSVDTDTLVTAIVGAGTKVVELTSTIDTLREEAATAAATVEVKELVRKGFVLPKKEAAMITLRLSNPDLFTELVPEQPVVKLSQENGEEHPDEDPEATVEAEVARLSKIAADQKNVYVRQ